MTAADPDPALRHGYTLARLDELARAAVFRSCWRFLSVQERLDIARSAIAEGIYAAAQAPAPNDLVRLAVKAIRVHVSDRENTWGRYLSGHGRRRQRGGTTSGGGAEPG